MSEFIKTNEVVDGAKATYGNKCSQILLVLDNLERREKNKFNQVALVIVKAYALTEDQKNLGELKEESGKLFSIKYSSLLKTDFINVVIYADIVKEYKDTTYYERKTYPMLPTKDNKIQIRDLKTIATKLQDSRTKKDFTNIIGSIKFDEESDAHENTPVNEENSDDGVKLKVKARK